jgi:asparagine synthase (glutamine-hydrolysing)
MLVALRHRGPDGEAEWSAGGARLAAARLGIIDPGAGPRPITNEDGRLSIAFNGEIYNHRELRAQLKRSGHSFSTGTDTEVVLHCYEESGEDCVRRLRGMFAFAIADGERVFLARDRLGIKPLYYACPGPGHMIFASEIKAIVQSDDLAPRLDLRALADKLVLGHATGTRTFVEGVQSLAAGHTMTVTWSDGTARLSPPRRYFDPFRIRDADIGIEEALRDLTDVLEDAVERHLAADVPVGLTLSGGLDSTVLALFAREKSAGALKTFAVADEPSHPDLAQAAHVAEMIGAEHHGLVATFEEYLAAIPTFVAAEEQPSSLYGLPFHLLASHVAGHVKASLHGEGADELFGGYREYLDRWHRTSAIAQRLPLLKSLGVAPSDEAVETIERLSSARSFNDYLEAIFTVNLGDALERLHLDSVDKSAMAAGLEMRVPYLDDRVYELVCGLPVQHLVRADLGIRKYALRRLCLERFGTSVADVVLRSKLGVPSAGVHHLQRLDRLCEETLPADYLEGHPLGFCFSTKRELLMLEMFVDLFTVHRGDTRALGDFTDYLGERADGRATAAALAQVGEP